MVERVYHDPLHGAIALDQSDPTEALLIQLIDTPAFQRLRRIRQLGPASLTFHGAEGSRFTHSLGVLAVARRAFDRIARDYPQLLPHRTIVLCAALLHDIGHAAFSHTAEEIFGSDHELWTRRILRESEPIRQLLDRFSPDLIDQLEAVFLKKYPLPLVWQLVSSQLDCDRLDYLMRDSYFTGASYGHIDLDRILMAMRYDPVTQQLVVAKKGMAAIEHYLIVRYFMYSQVYNHRKNIAATWVLLKTFQQARYQLKLGNLEADQNVRAWLNQDGNQIELDQYLAGDDGAFLYHFQQWRSHSDPVLADLSRRFLDRDLLKSLDISQLEESDRDLLLEKARYWTTQAGFDSSTYCGLRIAVSRGYTLYDRGIHIQTTTGLREIGELSALVQTLTQPIQKVWLIYLREIDDKIKSFVDKAGELL
ncbi:MULTISPECIES: HD domain-containing protein [Leptolyngbya]|jgi:HD superfamily phosphohydrolase|uniref:Metal dependent phosphohydrolase n=1 Tax=Leptolyngbya boryana NIES-2135 TaxID=1973484 RepID=A0A1Z4JI10_LEPBY|nr:MULTISPECIES: HD domain-containing protein [Leptolyngbya]BAY56167.1 metal dependent phosphohydrolase [Leptolyngbya boryana NIES-2135]MBD1855931.1 HD domain-containing protein [Leptolyngbya sp. FACHB-1624]MBD2366276.1 HD domain-containing protein [Leptolyngbya sp. FACHB-161]MBD2372456.1 HD domain-containing protein [Leptolyngbya sp. FACHB-238]MBD2396879.1 HD domain-containing protein [Leptolyngbya sp. FACHB-239]